MQRISDWFTTLSSAIKDTQVSWEGKPIELDQGLQQFQHLLRNLKSRNKRLWWVGNGGSAAICAHLSQDTLNKLSIRSQVLTDASLITCMANDFGYENVYSRPLQLLVDEGDMLIAISSSGNSSNILKCVELAEQRGLSIVSLSSFKPDNRLKKFNHGLSFYLPSKLYGIAEVGHQAILHSAIETLHLQQTADPGDFLNPPLENTRPGLDLGLLS